MYKLERWLDNDREKIVGIVVEYTWSHSTQKAAVIQLYVCDHCLVYQVCRAISPSDRFYHFLRNEKYICFRLQHRGGKEMLDCSGPWVQNLSSSKWSAGRRSHTAPRIRICWWTPPPLSWTSTMLTRRKASERRSTNNGQTCHCPTSRWSMLPMYGAYKIWTCIVNFNKGLLQTEEKKRRGAPAGSGRFAVWKMYLYV